MNVTQELVKEYLYYNKYTGKFYWKKAPSRNVDKFDIAGTLINGYIKIGIKGKQYFAHRLAFLYETGKIPKYVDHIDGNKSNNSWNNLRNCSSSENGYNSKIPINNTSGIKGVYWNKRKNQWDVQIRVNKELRFFGNYKDKSIAEQVAKAARKLYHKQFARSE